MKALGFFCLILLSPWISFAQNFTSITGIQNISNGALWVEYIKHNKANKSVTIVFESGALSNSNYWNPVFDSISTFANTIRYDRAGLGRSFPSIDSVRSSVQIAQELNELLNSLKIENQIILVCHSAGGLYGRTFSHLFGDRVKALVLIESPCTQWEALIRSSLTETQNEERDSILKENRLELSFFERKEYEASEMNRKFLEQLPPLQIPLFIIHGSNHSWPESYNRNLFNEKWKECQSWLSRISTKSQTLIIKQAGHHVFEEFNLSKFLYEKIAGLN